MAESSQKTFFISTAIDYVNAKPHVGHALEKVQADVIARQKRKTEDVFFLTGSDENSLKNVEAAKKAGVSTELFVEQNADAFYDLKTLLNISFDCFIRTTEERHIVGSQKMWKSFDQDDLYKKKYSGLYCVGCEEFKMPKDLIDGKCPDHLTVPQTVEEENWFFRLSNYGDRLKKMIESGEIAIFPDFRKNEILSFIDMGLADFSVSRSVERAQGWGVPVPGDETQIMYVWVDALSNYITALDYATEGELYKRYWQHTGDRVHVIGKGILRFHAIYWPAMLLSAKLPLPNRIYAHEYVSVNGQKMSKTLGNIIHPEELVAKYGVDGARYLLLTSLPYTKDGDISWEKMSEKYNADLANGLGNLVSRVVKLSQQLEEVPTGYEAQEANSPIGLLLEEYKFAEALGFVWQQVPWIHLS